MIDFHRPVQPHVSKQWPDECGFPPDGAKSDVVHENEYSVWHIGKNYIIIRNYIDMTCILWVCFGNCLIFIRIFPFVADFASRSLLISSEKGEGGDNTQIMEQS